MVANIKIIPDQKIMKLNLPYFIFVWLIAPLFAALPVLGAENCQMNTIAARPPQTDWPASPLTAKTIGETTNIPEMIQYFFEWGVGLGGLAVFIALVIAGIQYITSVADPGKVKEAKERIKSSAIGLALLLGSWAIFNLINPALNTLQDISGVKESPSGYGTTTNLSCEDPWDCCRENETGCLPENFACCEKNNFECMQGNGDMKRGAGGIGDPCTEDHDCASGYCKCHKEEDPWAAKCAENPKVCIKVMGNPILGCDFIGFFEGPDFTGTETLFNVKYGDSGWFTPQGSDDQFLTVIRSYQAYRAARNPSNPQQYYMDDGSTTTDINMAKMIPCGQSACGCKLSVCNDPGATQNSCINIVDYGLAFNMNLDESNHEVVRIQDQTKGNVADLQ